MKTLWSRLEAWASKNSKRSLGLRPGASPKAIFAAEKTMGLTFPDDYRASLLAHDGQEGDPEELFEWLPGCSPLKPLAETVKRWKEEQGLAKEYPGPPGHSSGPLHTALWHPKPIPVAGNKWWDGDNTYVDLYPSAKGTAGQITMFVSESDLACLGSSLAGAVESYLAALESGDWVFSKDKGFVTPKGEKADDYPHESYEFVLYLAKAKRKTKANASPKTKTKR